MAYEQGKDIRREIGLKWGLAEEQIKEKEERLEQRVQQREIFEAKRDKIVSALLQQCADEGLTYEETRDTINQAVSIITGMLNDRLMDYKHSQLEYPKILFK